jgi:hypothetical protein
MQEGKIRLTQLSVALELQADFYAGVWHYNQQMNTILEDGDIEALSAAHAVGDDAINLKCKVILFRIFYTRNLWTTQILVYEGYNLNQGNSFDAQR